MRRPVDHIKFRNFKPRNSWSLVRNRIRHSNTVMGKLSNDNLQVGRPICIMEVTFCLAIYTNHRSNEPKDFWYTWQSKISNNIKFPNESFQYLKNKNWKKNLLLAAFTQRWSGEKQSREGKNPTYLILHNSLQHKHQSDKLQNITRGKNIKYNQQKPLLLVFKREKKLNLLCL